MNLKTFFKTTICLCVIYTILLGQNQVTFDYRLQREGFKYIENSELGFSKEESMKIQIWGEVKQTGVYIIPKYATLLDVISIAGGPLPEADLSKIRLVYRLEGSDSQGIENQMIIDLEDFLQSGKFATEPKLGNETIIIIPRNSSAKFFDSLPKFLNVLNIISVGILLYSWLK